LQGEIQWHGGQTADWGRAAVGFRRQIQKGTDWIFWLRLRNSFFSAPSLEGKIAALFCSRNSLPSWGGRGTERWRLYETASMMSCDCDLFDENARPCFSLAMGSVEMFPRTMRKQALLFKPSSANTKLFESKL
jgi:hypothetical protein